VLTHEHILREDCTDGAPDLLERDGVYHAALPRIFVIRSCGDVPRALNTGTYGI
jgi:hypothetical protein